MDTGLQKVGSKKSRRAFAKNERKAVTKARTERKIDHFLRLANCLASDQCGQDALSEGEHLQMFATQYYREFFRFPLDGHVADLIDRWEKTARVAQLGGRGSQKARATLNTLRPTLKRIIARDKARRRLASRMGNISKAFHTALAAKQVLKVVAEEAERVGPTISECVFLKDFLFAVSTADPYRIRRCRECNRFFYAWVRTRKSCSEKCAGLARQRKFRKGSDLYAKREARRAAKERKGRENTAPERPA